MKKMFSLSNLRALSALLAILLVIPLPWKGLTGFYAWLSPFIMLNSVFTLKSLVVLNAVAFLVLVFILFRKRWFCHNLCPVGWGCDLVSGLNTKNNFTYKRVAYIGKWLVVFSLASALVGFPVFIILDPMAIFNGFFDIFSNRLNLVAIISLSGLPVLLLIHLFMPGIWCSRLCPLGGLQLLTADIKTLINRILNKRKQEALTTGAGRRYFIMSGLGLLAGVSIRRFIKPSSVNIIRPPGAVEPALFNLLCCRCGNCTKVCPTGIITPHTGNTNILTWLTPEIRFTSGYCLETCNLCSRICPSGAIKLFSVKAKAQLFMGTAVVRLDDCLLLKNKECIKCKESCKFDAIEFVPRGSFLNMIPVVDEKKCVGCGACGVICPEGCIVINPL